jgi:hypothetical protein
MATKKVPAKKAAAKKAAPKKEREKATRTLPPSNSAAYKAMILRGEIKE